MHNAGIMQNRSLLAKADLALSDLLTDGGLLLPAQANRFIRILIKEAVIMRMATVVPMRSHKQQIDRIRMGSRVLRAGEACTPLPKDDHHCPETSQTELDAKFFKAQCDLCDEVLEDNIERDRLRNTIMQLMTEAIGRDMDEIIVQGDTASSDPFLAQFDGVLKQATSNIVNNAGASLTKTTFRDMLKAMPSEFLRRKDRMAFLTSVDAKIDYIDTLADRATLVGDRFLERDANPLYAGVPLMDVPLFPENLGPSMDQTCALLLDPKNIHVGIWRSIRIETDKDIEKGVLKIVASMRFDVKYAYEPAVVKATNVAVC